MSFMRCDLCGRDIPENEISRHHLVPKCKGGKDTQPLHQICHSKIHSLFSESELGNYYDTIEKIREHEEIEKFIKWVRKKPNDFRDSNIMSKNLKLRKRK